MELVEKRRGRMHTWHDRSLGVGLRQTQEPAGEPPELETELVGWLLVENLHDDLCRRRHQVYCR